MAGYNPIHLKTNSVASRPLWIEMYVFTPKMYVYAMPGCCRNCLAFSCLNIIFAMILLITA